MRTKRRAWLRARARAMHERAHRWCAHVLVVVVVLVVAALVQGRKRDLGALGGVVLLQAAREGAGGRGEAEA